MSDDKIMIDVKVGVINKILKIQGLQSKEKTDLFYYGLVDWNHILDKSLELMLKSMKKEIEERKK